MKRGLPGIPGSPDERWLLVGNRSCGAVELRDRHAEWLVVGRGPILQHTKRHLFSQQNRIESGTPEVDSRVDPVTKRNVERQLAQLSVDRKAIRVRTRVNVERTPIVARHVYVASRSRQQRPEILIAVEKELKRRYACASHSSMASRVARVSRTAFRKRLRHQVAAICFVHHLGAEGIQDISVKRSSCLRTP